MKTTLCISIILIASFACASLVFAEAAPQKVIDFAGSTLASFGSDAAVVSAVKAENAKGKTLDDIKAKDEVWKNMSEPDDFMKGILNNSCAEHLRKYQGKHAFLSEIFVMDDKGGNVVMTDITSDYWQGDEAKFIESFKGGSGAVHISEVEFDDSAQVYQVQVSVPVVDGGKAIGAICFGINLDAFE